MASRKGRILAGVTGILVVGCVVAGAVIRDNRSKVVVQTGKAGKRDLVSLVSASGEVKPKRYVNVGANVSGRITKLFVKEGDRVKNGQVLAQIDSTRLEADVRQSDEALRGARADLDRALADLEATRLAYERSKRMRADQLVSEQAWEQADADLKVKAAIVESQRRRIAQLAAALASNKDTLDKTVVFAPMDGIVTSLPKEEGEVVIGAQSFQPTVIMTVGDLSVMEVEIMVDETDIRHVQLGQPAEVRVDALEGVKIQGEVTEIGASAIPRGTTAAAGSTGTNTGNQAKDFKVTVTLKDPPSNMRPGLNATADITTDRKPHVLAVPIQSVVVREVDKEGKVVDPGSVLAAEGDPAKQTKPTGEEKEGVFVISKGQAAFRPVKTGIIGETEIEIVSGIAEGDEIVTGSYKTLRTLKDAARVKIETKKDRT